MPSRGLCFLLLAQTACALAASEEARLLARVRRGDAPAALELAQRGEPGVRQLRAGLLRSNRTAALCAWALWRHPHPAAGPELRGLLLGPHQVAAYWAARALGRLGDPSSASALAKLLPHEQNAFWELASRGMPILALKTIQGKRRRVPAPAWMPNLRSSYAALLALGRIGGPLAEDTLLRGLQNRQYLIRCAAAKGLGAMAAARALPALQRLAQDDPVLIVRQAAAQAAAKIRSDWTPPRVREPKLPPAILFIKTKNRTESNLGFRDSYFFPKTPWYAWGENLYSLSPPSANGRLVNLTHLTNGAVQGPDVSYDGTRVLFAMRRDFKTDGFHIYEMNVDGSGLRQITAGNCNDVDPCYLPDGRIAFCSDRAGYREYYHQERSRVLYTSNLDGSHVRQITFNPNQDYEPSVLSDGRLLYGSYRFYAQDGSPGPVPGDHFMQRIETVLRTVNPNGSHDQLYYGAMRGSFFTPLRPMMDSLQYSGWHRRGNHIGVSTSQPKELPSGKIVCITPAGLTLVDPHRDPTDCEMPFFPEVLNLAGGEETYIYNHDDMNPVGRFTSPCPLDDEWLIVSHAPWYDLRRSGYGLYLFHMPTRTLRKLYDDPAMSEIDAVLVAPRPRPRVIPTPPAHRAAALGYVYCNSVFNSDLPYDHAVAKSVRVIEGIYMGLSINANASFRTRILGETALAEDGSFRVQVPADTPIRFQLLDAQGRVVVHETAFNYVRPGERKGCIGCHEPKDASPANGKPLAILRPAYRALRKRGALIYQGRESNTYSLIVR